MSLSDLSSIGGAVSAVALLISLLLLNLQVSQETRNQRALIQQGRAGRTADIAMRLMASDFAEVYSHCTNGEINISKIQLVQFMGYCRAVFLGAEDSFLQHRESQLDELAFVSFTTSLRVIFAYPGMRAIWKMTREWYGPEFVVFMDNMVKEVPSRPHPNQLLQWKAIVAGEAIPPLGCDLAPC